uniref:Uncharacterized protein n=1 Tax=Physcomitrium patens TaxID=3218 RepID=A0A2K1J2W1_PHYPA|nr:hypothetical protein PHYPA_021715 [Physcomitrium patens]
MENLWDVVSGKETQPTPVQEVNATSTSPSTNQTEILTWKRKDHVALAAIWECVENPILKIHHTKDENWRIGNSTYTQLQKSASTMHFCRSYHFSSNGNPHSHEVHAIPVWHRDTNASHNGECNTPHADFNPLAGRNSHEKLFF